jgi:hypothetical protein
LARFFLRAFGRRFDHTAFTRNLPVDLSLQTEGVDDRVGLWDNAVG